MLAPGFSSIYASVPKYHSEDPSSTILDNYEGKAVDLWNAMTKQEVHRSASKLLPENMGSLSHNRCASGSAFKMSAVDVAGMKAASAPHAGD